MQDLHKIGIISYFLESIATPMNTLLTEEHLMEVIWTQSLQFSGTLFQTQTPVELLSQETGAAAILLTPNS